MTRRLSFRLSYPKGFDLCSGLDVPEWCPKAFDEQLTRDETRDDFFSRLNAAFSRAIVTSLDKDLRSSRCPAKVIRTSRKRNETDDD